jgi:hypothetical protein
LSAGLYRSLRLNPREIGGWRNLPPLNMRNSRTSELLWKVSTLISDFRRMNSRVAEWAGLQTWPRLETRNSGYRSKITFAVCTATSEGFQDCAGGRRACQLLQNVKELALTLIAPFRAGSCGHESIATAMRFVGQRTQQQKRWECSCE